jgi:hypothetical protein
VRLISIIVQLGAIVANTGLETEERCRNLAAMATTSIPDPLEAQRLQEELAVQFSLVSFGDSLGSELAPHWEEMLDLVDSIRCASSLH